MKPINIIIIVVTVIEALRAFDIVWVINKGTNGLELISTLVTANVVGEASRIVVQRLVVDLDDAKGIVG